MKIAILSCFYPYRGGISQFNACLYTELKKNHTVKAFNFKRQYPDFLFPGKTQYVTDNDEAVPVESERVLDTVNPFSYIRTLRKIKAWGPDLLIVRYWMSFFAPSLGYVTRHIGKSCKVVSILDNVIPHERHFFDTPFTKYFLGGSDGCVTLCDAVKEDLEKIRPGKKAVTIPHPLYSHFGRKRDRKEAEDTLGIPHGSRNILFFGLIREYKGLDILLEAFSGLGEEYRLIIAGEPYGSFDRYEELIGKDGRDRIHTYLHYVRDSEVTDFFSAADVVVLPYRTATQSGISSISYHFDVPMIVTDTGGLKAAIGDTGTGLVADSISPEAVRKEIVRYFSDPEIRENCIRNIEKEKKRLSWTAFCDALTRFSNEL